MMVVVVVVVVVVMMIIIIIIIIIIFKFRFLILHIGLLCTIPARSPRLLCIPLHMPPPTHVYNNKKLALCKFLMRVTKCIMFHRTGK